MKKIIALLIVMAVGTGVYAQGEGVSKFFAKYATDESFTTATISSKMFSLITNMDVQTPEDKEIIDAISKLKGLKVVKIFTDKNYILVSGSVPGYNGSIVLIQK